MMWRYINASSIGTSHKAENLPCQDYGLSTVISRTNGAPVLLAAVSDGAGSAMYSQEGSAIACKTFLHTAKDFLSKNPLAKLSRTDAEEWITVIRDAIAKEAQMNNRKSRDYACTFLAALVSETEAAYLQIGDGAIVVSEGDVGSWRYIFWPQNGQYANETFFVSDESSHDHLEFKLETIAANDIALFTDGIQNLVLDTQTKTVFARFFDAMFPALYASPIKGFGDVLSQGLQTYLSSATICERTDDDKTLMMATRRPLTVAAE